MAYILDCLINISFQYSLIYNIIQSIYYIFQPISFSLTSLWYIFIVIHILEKFADLIYPRFRNVNVAKIYRVTLKKIFHHIMGQVKRVIDAKNCSLLPKK